MLSIQITGGIIMDTEKQSCDMSATLKQYPVNLVHLNEIAHQMKGKTNP
jgi:hypothetical protein